MSSSWVLPALLAVLVTSCVLAHDEDFAFDVSDDLEVEFPQETPKKLWGMPDMTATVGHVFHLAIPTGAFGEDVKNYEAKMQDGKPLPSWLLFDKTTGTFWGVPLSDNIGELHITVKAFRQSSKAKDDFKLVVNESGDLQSTEKCPPLEDNTVLTLLIDKGVNSIKPKQRVVSINNIAKFFGLPYSAFTLGPQVLPDDITDSSVVLAGPGNLESRTSKLTSLLQVTVGCEGRLWLNTAPLVHQLKQQSRDGTISEVLRLPLIGWRVKTETRPLLRKKREEDGYTGSGDYDDEDDYYEYDYVEGDEDEPTSSATPTSTTVHSTASINTNTYSPTTPPLTSETHPHRHHHGENRPIDEISPEEPLTNIPKEEYPHITEPSANPRSEVTEIQLIPVYISPQEEETHTSASSQATTVTTTTSRVTYPVTEPEIITQRTGLYKPSESFGGSEDEYEEYDDTEDDEESETEVPITNTYVPRNQNELEPPPDIPDDTEPPTETTASKQKTETVEYIPQTSPVTTTVTTTTTTTTTTLPTTTIKETTVSEILLPVTTTTETVTTVPTTTTTEKVTTEDDTTIKHTTLRHTTTQKATTTTQQVTDIDYEIKNFPPTIQNRLKRIAVTAGKIFSFVIPEDTFTDTEDGIDLKLEFLDDDEQPIKKELWCQFNARSRELYGLPLDDDVSRWQFIIRATDREGASVSDRLEVIVQQHKFRRVVNHEFSLYIRVEKKQEFPHSVDWALRTLRGLGGLYHMANLSEITVRSVNYTNEPVVFTWTNDSLPKNYCPKADIEKLFSILTANDEGDPSLILSRSLAPELRVKKVLYKGLGVCELQSQPQPPPQSPITPPTNFSPILRNHVDHINATVGELLTFTVPDDTFYDHEDVDSHYLKLSLLTINRQPIPTENWLQFDGKNKEFYGIPLPKDVGRKEYQLVCEDSGGLTASDSLVVEVHPAPKVNYNMEFSMTLETEYETFATSPNMQRKFVEKLKELFDDHDTSHVHLISISRGSTIVNWYNKSLTTEKCPNEDLRRLKSILVNRDKGIASRVQDIMMPEFPVSKINLHPLGVCEGRPTHIQPPFVKSSSDKPIPYIPPPDIQIPEAAVPVDESASKDTHNEYMITFIVPAVIITIMLLLAGIAACVLYRRRRSGKMNVEEDGRQSYGNKGIPVIFQEELEEKPEPGTKTPVILKDEKPPLAPPEYSKSGSLKLTDDSEPYQPPPPFARPQDNGRQARPKPTPTYRKPPPYVPP